MKRFISTELFRALREASHKGSGIDARISERGYDEFTGQLFSQSAVPSVKAAYRTMLVYTRAALSGLTGVPGKNAMIYLCKALKPADMQIEWVEKLLPAGQNTSVHPANITGSSTYRSLLSTAF